MTTLKNPHTYKPRCPAYAPYEFLFYIVSADDFNEIVDNTTYFKSEDAHFAMAYLDGRAGYTVIAINDEGEMYRREGANWIKVASEVNEGGAA